MTHTITYTIKPGQPDVEPEVNGFQNVITRVLWDMVGVSDDGFEEKTSASTDLPEPTEGQPFTAIEDLDAPTIVGWIEQHTPACRGENYLDERKAIVADLIDKARNPYVPPKAPWIEEPAQAEEIPAQAEDSPA